MSKLNQHQKYIFLFAKGLFKKKNTNNNVLFKLLKLIIEQQRKNYLTYFKLTKVLNINRKTPDLFNLLTDQCLL